MTCNKYILPFFRNLDIYYPSRLAQEHQLLWFNYLKLNQLCNDFYRKVIGFARILFLRGNPITFFLMKRCVFSILQQKKKRTPIYGRKSKKVRFFLDSSEKYTQDICW